MKKAIRNNKRITKKKKKNPQKTPAHDMKFFLKKSGRLMHCVRHKGRGRGGGNELIMYTRLLLLSIFMPTGIYKLM